MSSNSLTLNWTAVTDKVVAGQETSGWAATEVYRNGVLVVNPNNPVPAPLTTFVDTNLQPNTLYNYTLRAVDLAGNKSALSAVVPGTTQGTGLPPATKIVQPDGAGGAFTTLQAAINAAVAGDVIELRSNTAGGTTTQTANLLVSGKNGTSANRITIRVRGNDKWLFKSSTTSPILRFLNSSWWEVEGSTTGRVGLVISDPAAWNPLTGGRAGPHGVTLQGHNSHHITFRRCSIHGNATGNKGIFVRRDCFKWKWEDCELSRHGEPDTGDMLDIYSHRSLIKDCLMKWGGHDNLSAASPWLVVINTTFDGDWTGADPSLADIGSRLYGMTGMAHDNWSPSGIEGNQHTGITTANTWEFGPQCLHNVTVKTCRPTVSSEPTCKKQSYKLIERGTLFTDLRAAHVWLGPTYGTANDYEGDGKFPGPCQAHNYTYHTTSYESNGVWNNDPSAWKSVLHQNSEMREFMWKNGVSAQLHDNFGGRGVVFWRLDPVPQEGYPDKWKGMKWTDWIFQGDATQMSFELQGVEKDIAGNVAENFWPLSLQNLHSQTGALGFANPGARTRAGLTITSGVGFQDAAPLTTTTAGGTSTTLPVVDAWWFTDWANPAEWDMADLGLENDYIAVGATLATATIAQIDAILSRTSIRLKSSLTFSNGHGVWFAGNPVDGAPKIWKNRGCGQ